MKNSFGSNDFFLLFANCIPVKGYRRATICDLQRGDYFIVPNSLVELLNQLKKTPINDMLKNLNKEDKETALSYIEYLIKYELGFLTDDPIKFPLLDLTFKSPFLVNDMILELSSVFIDRLDNLIEQITQLGVPFIEIRMNFDDYQLLEKFLEKTKYTRTRSLNIICEYSYEQKHKMNFRNLIDTYSIIGHISIHSVPENKIKKLRQHNTPKLTYTSSMLTNETCGKIDKDFFTTNIGFFTESMQANNCLNKKITIDKYGNIKNCPSIKNIYGNILTDKLASVLENPIFQSYSKIKKDEIEVCKDCEFRYVCSDCRAHIDNIYNKPQYCNYNPYTATYDK